VLDRFLAGIVLPKARVDLDLIFAVVEEPKSRTSPNEHLREKAEEFRKSGGEIYRRA